MNQDLCLECQSKLATDGAYCADCAKSLTEKTQAHAPASAEQQVTPSSQATEISQPVISIDKTVNNAVDPEKLGSWVLPVMLISIVVFYPVSFVMALWVLISTRETRVKNASVRIAAWVTISIAIAAVVVSVGFGLLITALWNSYR